MLKSELHAVCAAAVRGIDLSGKKYTSVSPAESPVNLRQIGKIVRPADVLTYECGRLFLTEIFGNAARQFANSLSASEAVASG